MKLQFFPLSSITIALMICKPMCVINTAAESASIMIPCIVFWRMRAIWRECGFKLNEEHLNL